jgi:tetratricopeptide (TPR) repeat protein
LSLDPENPDYLYSATEIFEQLKYPLEAVAIYERIISLQFDDDEMYMDYAELLVELDDVEEAIVQLICGVHRFPHCEDLHLMLAGYMLATGDNFGAANHLCEASALSDEALDKFAEYFPELLTDQNVQIIIQGLK